MPDQAAQKTDADKGDKPVTASRQPSPPLIFISHDSRDAELAEAFAKLLSSVSCGMLKSFRSSDKKGSQGIEYGLEWYPELMGKLGDSTAVLCLLTERSINRPWILYEAGVAKGKLDTPVYGIALGISLSKANTGPFAQFQNCDDDTESLTNLVMQLLSRIPNSAPDSDAVIMQVDAFTVKKEQVLTNLGQADEDDDTASPDASVARLFEEVKLMFQDLPAKVEGRIADRVDPARTRRKRRFHPKMFDEFLMMSDEADAPIGLLMMLSFYREEMPWLYDLGKTLYDAIQVGNEKKTMAALHQLQSTLKMARHHPLMEDMMSSKEGHILLMELPRMLEHYVERFQMHRSSRRSGSSKESS